MSGKSRPPNPTTEMTRATTRQTLRQQMISLLSEEALSPRDLSQLLGVQEKEVYPHLSHIARSVASKGKDLIIMPCRCLECEYVFTNRKRFTKPSRCPRCRKSHIEQPRFLVKSRPNISTKAP